MWALLDPLKVSGTAVSSSLATGLTCRPENEPGETTAPDMLVADVSLVKMIETLSQIAGALGETDLVETYKDQHMDLKVKFRGGWVPDDILANHNQAAYALSVGHEIYQMQMIDCDGVCELSVHNHFQDLGILLRLDFLSLDHEQRVIGAFSNACEVDDSRLVAFKRRSTASPISARSMMACVPSLSALVAQKCSPSPPATAVSTPSPRARLPRAFSTPWLP
ncbi:Alpha-L-rhamnosidase [Fusarium falciforme]|uniref:Alpha-L-rhamnosidase n=1 Tax=Fusarium falciforme TaxID=195108 RepID=UPI002301052D|nr:Alpha-L-rhamnosidase [Fusarium falciforme]WAO97355.1 Alpha-L-rhamnosidase [Fusarium falciforme]